jgi:hypothetical protein
MQGERAGEPAGPDVWETCRELIPAGSVFAFLAGRRELLFPAGSGSGPALKVLQSPDILPGR